MLSFYSCSSDNGSIIETNEDPQEIQDLQSMYSKLKNRDVKFVDDLIKKYEETESSNNLKSSSSLNDRIERMQTYIERYLPEIDNMEELEEVNPDFEYLGEINLDEITNEIINDSYLVTEDKEILILTFTYMDVIVKNIEKIIEECAVSSPTDCLAQYRTTLTNINNKYMGKVVGAWVKYFSGNLRGALMDSATILRDALNGKHIQEIRAAENTYQNCLKALPETVVPVPGGKIRD